MVFKGFVGQSYRSMSPRLGCEETVNLYLEHNKTANKFQFYKSPGLIRAWTSDDDVPVPAMMLRSRFTVQEVWALIGNDIVYFHFALEPVVPGYVQQGTLSLVNTFSPVVADGNKAYFAASPDGNQVVLVTNSRAWMVEADVLTELTWFGVEVTQVALINNYFLFLSAEGDGFFYSEPGDAEDGDPLNFRSAESSANTFKALVVDRNVDIWLFGDQVTQIFYNDVNDPEEPFKPNPSAAMETGIAGPNLALAANNRVWWIDENYIFRASNGYIPERISTHAVENEVRTYGDITDGYVWTATWNGHIVIRWTFPSAQVEIKGNLSDGMTWQYDTTTGDWTRQISFDEANNRYTAHRGMSSCEPVLGKQLVGDRANGAIYILTPDVQTDDCTRSPWFRRCPIINQEGFNISYPRFELGIQPGVGRPLGDFSDATCNVVPVPTNACGSLEGDLEFLWTHNSRVGPFMGTSPGEIFFIGQDPNNTKRLIAVRTTNYGETWAIVNDVFPTLANVIISHDCHDKDTENDDLDVIMVATQEDVGSGRVAYHEFDKETATWTLLDQTVVMSASLQNGSPFMNGGTVSVTRLSTGVYGILYDTDIEDVGGDDYFRYGYRESNDSGVTWGSEYQSGQAGNTVNYCAARVVADNDGRVQLFCGDTDTPFFGHRRIQTLTAAKSLSAIVEFAQGGALSQINQGRHMGDYCTFEDGGSTVIAFTGRELESAYYALWTSADSMTLPDQSVNMGGNSTFLGVPYAYCPQVSASFAGGLLHIMGNKFDNNVPTWFWHKSDGPPYTSMLPATDNADQSGPLFDEGDPDQEMAARVVEVDENTYYMSLRNSGDTLGLGLVFNWIRTDQLPTSDAMTISAWEEACPTANTPPADLPWADDFTQSPEFNPNIYLIYSNNWGQTFSNELYRNLGEQGDWDKQVIWDRLGTGRQRVFEVGGSAAVPICIDEAYIGEPEALKV